MASFENAHRAKASKDEINELSGKILDCCIAVHREIGAGLLESVYEACLLKEFELREITAEKQVKIPLVYKGHNLNKDFFIDILVENEIILELKAVDAVSTMHEAQLINYLKLTDKRLGLLVNFNVPLMKNGFKRYINNLD